MTISYSIPFTTFDTEADIQSANLSDTDLFNYVGTLTSFTATALNDPQATVQNTGANWLLDHLRQDLEVLMSEIFRRKGPTLDTKWSTAAGLITYAAYLTYEVGHGSDFSHAAIAVADFIAQVTQFQAQSNSVSSQQANLEAVQQNGLAIKNLYPVGADIPEPVQLEAVKQNGRSIKFIINTSPMFVSEAVQLAAVEHSAGPMALKSILNAGITPSIAVQVASINKDQRCIVALAAKGVLSEDESVQLAAVSKWPQTIWIFNNPSTAAKNAARAKGIVI